MIGIYSIRNTVSDKVYIGKTVNIHKRFLSHKRELNRDNHHNKFLQRAWDNDGEENFIFEVLEECTRENINEREVYYIAFYQSNNSKFGYNHTEGGNGTSGYNISEEHKEKLRKANKGQIPWHKGKHGVYSQESLDKMSESNRKAHLGKPSGNKIPVTQEMIDDVNSGMKRRHFIDKYKTSLNVWYRIKTGNIENFKKKGE